jgi:hypothetical protein
MTLLCKERKLLCSISNEAISRGSDSPQSGKLNNALEIDTWNVLLQKRRTQQMLLE